MRIIGAARLCVLSLVLLTAGCGAEAAGSTTARPAAASFDLFRGDDLGLIDHAIQIVRNKCLADAGYPQNLDVMASAPTSSFPYMKITPRTFGPTTDEEARRSGFGMDEPAQPGRVVSFDPNYDKNLERCQEKANGEFGAETRKVVNSYKDLGNLLYNEFTGALGRFVDEELDDVPRKLLDCLDRAGYRPADEAAFLAEPDHRVFGIDFGTVEGGEDTWSPTRRTGAVEVGPPVPAKRYVPTEAESKFAVAWFGCRREIGLTDQLVERSSTIQAELVDKHESEFAELNSQIEEIARAAAAVAGR